ncbi:MAG: preprotein translocase subunit SecA [Gammaproteobacteria bacterium]|nr:preprotein translocase subunit SecA [Gammaproteobacteria bacterium]
MVANIFRKVFGSRNDRYIKRLRPIVERVNELENEISDLSDEDLIIRTEALRQRASDGESLDSLIPEAFATVREAGKRVHNMRHFDVQLIGGMVLNQGKIAEMRTGEGKTLVATLAGYLNALPGEGVHVVTVNDYLAKRDAEWMGQIYRFLGMTVGVIYSGQDQQEKRDAYACDIVYGTNNEFGFDYLRDNMAFSSADRVQRKLNFAIIDEVDSILIDEARTPLIISGAVEDKTDLYISVNKLIPGLVKQEEEDGPGDFSVDEKARQVYLTEEGHQHVEELLENAGLLGQGESLYEASNITLMHHINCALRAHVLFQKDVHYVVNNDEVVIVDEFTGRTMPGRRWSDGLHQAVEAKEDVAIQQENQTLASITFQNFFRLYNKLSGMTGTADTEAFEFQQIYGLEVVVVPTHREMVRDDMTDLIYLTANEKYDAILEDIQDCYQRKQPVLVGTASIETSEYLSGLLNKVGVKHEVLNAKQHEREADIIAQAGSPGAITIATNMAGRGTDIVLGGNLEVALSKVDANDSAALQAANDEWQAVHEQVLESGGLHVIGTERHESRRIDNQLRGRSGRQGDAGSTRFYLSLEDNLMRIFASDRVANMMQKLGMQKGEAIEHGLVSKAIENAQRKVEGHNFDIRKQLLEYDDVANDQRKVVYEQRNELMDSDDVSDTINTIREDVVNEVISRHLPPGSLEEQWDVANLEKDIEQQFVMSAPIRQWLDDDDSLHEEILRQKLHDMAVESYREKEAQAGPEAMRHLEKAVMLRVLDNMWKDHLAAMDHLRQSINLRGYAQKNPKQEYKREAFDMFNSLLERIRLEVVTMISRVQVRDEEDVEVIEEQRRQQPSEMQYQHADSSAIPDQSGQPAQGEQGAEHVGDTFVRSQPKVGRNEPCPCGSGKKYKQCHGKLA